LKILVSVDGSEEALDAVHYALYLKREGLQANFLLVAVQEPIYGFEMLLPANASLVDRLSGAMGDRALAEAETLFTMAALSFEREIGSGDPAPVLLDLAERSKCDAIIMSARGRGALRSALLGSVSQAVLQSATIPVTIVKHRAPLIEAEVPTS
jgi:nucleotide-binding universal stress UspA family protein